MKPAFSVLVFTVSSGAGYGLLMWLLLLQLMTKNAVDLDFLIIAVGLGLILVTIGLLSSSMHLANPRNAWRAFNRFRTSWLSREGVFAVLFYPVIVSYGLVLWLNGGQMTWLAFVLGILSIVNALMTVICTGMIYASLKPIRQWYNNLTTPLYILFSLMSGSLSLMVLHLIMQGEWPHTLLYSFMVILVVTVLTKLAYFAFIGKPDGLTINTATGFSQAQVRLLDAGHNADTFLTKEFIFDTNAVKLMKLRKAMLLLTFILPFVLVAVALYLNIFAFVYLALALVFPGLLIERWLFFAEARHVVRLYHGDQHT